MSQNQKIPSQSTLTSSVYILTHQEYRYNGYSADILCEDGKFYKIEKVMSGDIRPILFLSKKEARSARKIYGRWPKYKIIKINDPSWLCE